MLQGWAEEGRQQRLCHVLGLGQSWRQLPSQPSPQAPRAGAAGMVPGGSLQQVVQGLILPPGDTCHCL